MLKILVLEDNANTICQDESNPDFDGLAIVADYDYSDAPEWAVPREWFIEGRYDLEQDII